MPPIEDGQQRGGERSPVRVPGRQRHDVLGHQGYALALAHRLAEARQGRGYSRAGGGGHQQLRRATAHRYAAVDLAVPDRGAQCRLVRVRGHGEGAGLPGGEELAELRSGRGWAGHPEGQVAWRGVHGWQGEGGDEQAEEQADAHGYPEDVSAGVRWPGSTTGSGW